MLAGDIKQKGIEIELDKTRHLIFDLNALCELEEKYGTMDNAMQELYKGSMKAVRYMLYLALQNEDEALTEKSVGKLINLNNIDNVSKALSTAMGVSLPENDEKNG
jgi:ATP-dependent protease HslVU (ClpYQ) ATPase subunit